MTFPDSTSRAAAGPLRRLGTVSAVLVLAALAGVASMRGAAAEPARYRIDPEHLSIGFLVSHIGYADTLGMFLRGDGGFTFDEQAPALSDLRVTIDAASVFTNHQRRDEHLRGDSFLDVERHPAIVFAGTGAERTGERTGRITGDLTLLGVTRPVTLDVTWNKSGAYPFGSNYVIGISARGTVRRSEFGMTYAVANGWVGDEVQVIIEAEAIRQ